MKVVAGLVVLVLLIFSYLPAEAKMGYKEEITVDNTTWCIERSTLPCTFEMEGLSSGTGMFIRDVSIDNFAGVSAKETAHFLSGNLTFSDKTTLISEEGPVVITIEIKGAKNITTNESVNITTNESVNITIREAWPTYFSTIKGLAYSGDGISTRERYENNGDVISTSFNVKNLVTVSRFDTVLLGLDVSAEILPGAVNETICSNKSTYYVLSSRSLGGKAYLGWRYREGIMKVDSSEYYIGNFSITTEIKMKHQMPPAPQNASNASIDWMPCPSSEPRASIDWMPYPSSEP
jgi:hypothetical protein